MPGEDDPVPVEKIHTLPFNPPVFDWNASNLYTEFRTFKTKVDFIFDGTYKNNPKDAKVGAILNWMGIQHLKFAITLYGPMQMTRQTTLKC